MATATASSATTTTTTAQQDKLFEDIVTQNQNYDHVERNFQEVLLELESDEILETFRREYEALHASFLKCHEGEKRLIKKCTDLHAEIQSCVMKVRSAEELSAGDQNTIESLRKEIVKAKSKIQLSKETEVTLKEKIKQLKVDIKELDRQVDRGAAGVVGHDSTIAELTRVRADLTKEHETQLGQLNSLSKDIENVERRVQRVEEEKAAKDAELRGLRQAIEDKNGELDDWRARKQRKEAELASLKNEVNQHNQQLLRNKAAVSAEQAEIRKLEEQVFRVKEDTDRVLKEFQLLTKQLNQGHLELHELNTANDQLAKEVAQQTAQLKIKQGEVANISREMLKQQKLVDAIEKRNAVLDTQRAEAENQRNATRIDIMQKELDISNLSKQAENDRKQLEDLTRERDILNKNYLKAQSATQKQKDWLMVKENQRRNLEHQLRGYERHSQRQADMIGALTKEAETYELEALEAAQRCNQALEEVRQQEQAIAEEQRAIQDAEGRLKTQQNLLETVLNERNLLSKNYNQLRSEIFDLRRKFKIDLNQIKQLKEEIQAKERELVREEAKVQAKTQERKDNEIKIDAYKKKTEKREKTIEAYNKELHKLNQIIADADAEKNRQKRDHTNVMNERDILGTQLIKRNDELAQLYERIRIQQSTLRKGEAQYNDRMRDLEQLELRCNQLDDELTQMQNFASRLPDLKLLINQTNRELTREQCRVRGLLDECDNPRNVHPLNRIKWSEPQTYDLQRRVWELQKELIQKSNAVEEKDRLIAEKEKLYVELKAIIARQPGPEVAEQLNVYQDSLQKKTGQMQAMKMSLKHFQEQVEHYKARFEELQTDLQHMNAAYMQTRRKMEKDARNRAIVDQMMGRAPGASGGAGSLGGAAAGAAAGSGGGSSDVYVGYTAPPRPQTSDELGGGGNNGDIPQLADDGEILPPPVDIDSDGNDAAAAAAAVGAGGGSGNGADDAGDYEDDHHEQYDDGFDPAGMPPPGSGDGNEELPPDTDGAGIDAL